MLAAIAVISIERGTQTTKSWTLDSPLVVTYSGRRGNSFGDSFRADRCDSLQLTASDGHTPLELSWTFRRCVAYGRLNSRLDANTSDTIFRVYGQGIVLFVLLSDDNGAAGGISFAAQTVTASVPKDNTMWSGTLTVNVVAQSAEASQQQDALYTVPQDIDLRQLVPDMNAHFDSRYGCELVELPIKQSSSALSLFVSNASCASLPTDGFGVIADLNSLAANVTDLVVDEARQGQGIDVTLGLDDGISVPGTLPGLKLADVVLVGQWNVWESLCFMSGALVLAVGSWSLAALCGMLRTPQPITGAKGTTSTDSAPAAIKSQANVHDGSVAPPPWPTHTQQLPFPPPAALHYAQGHAPAHRV